MPSLGVLGSLSINLCSPGCSRFFEIASFEKGKKMVRAIVLGLAVVLVVGFAGQTQAADGNLSSGMLADMGLSDMQVMSDAQGQEIRGMGYAAVWGKSYAYVRGAGARNGYSARGSNLAIGGTISGAINSRGRWAVGAGASAAYSR
jgi:hypothetical protein